MCYSLWYNAPTSCNTQSIFLEDGQNNCPKHVELTGFINNPLLLHLVGCLYYLYQWCTVKQISDNEIYLLIKYIKSVPCIVTKRLSYTDDARCVKVKSMTEIQSQMPLLALSTAGSKSKDRLAKSGKLWSVFIFTSNKIRMIFEVSADILRWDDNI